MKQGKIVDIAEEANKNAGHGSGRKSKSKAG
jgi:hypothetical protein